MLRTRSSTACRHRSPPLRRSSSSSSAAHAASALTAAFAARAACAARALGGSGGAAVRGSVVHGARSRDVEPHRRERQAHSLERDEAAATVELIASGSSSSGRQPARATVTAFAMPSSEWSALSAPLSPPAASAAASPFPLPCSS